ncbi:MAG TPA: SDR family oxidoreductase [Acidimicrobiales bacterium]|jgi:NAD(P)-dependent dehydrogenase (short-subunit alcohol dehydrogenase family)|nr:SDR family oxidoreductase [Acidimicrobiales bacterium]
MGRFNGRNVIVTGASRGIGAGIAERFAAEGANLVITARTLDQHDHLAGSLHETAARCERYGVTVVPIVADLADGDDRARIVPEGVAALGGPIDVLVNNAAAGIHRLAAELTLKHRRIMYEVNVHAPIDLAQAVIPAMRARGEGYIINISSGSSDLYHGPPFPNTPMGTTQGAYGATKAALNRYTNILGVELYGTGIRVNTLQPVKPVASEGAVIHLQGRIPADQFNPVEVMAEATLALAACSPDLTARICVDGPLLAELGMPVLTLDGSSVLDLSA